MHIGPHDILIVAGVQFKRGSPFHGSDATMLFLILMAEYVRWSADLELARKLRPIIDAALDWMDNYADADGDGYFDYAGKYENELVNQGRKDSGNAIVNADGSLPPTLQAADVLGHGG